MTNPADDNSDINLTPPALKPAKGSPWGDDALQRQGIASELSALATALAEGEDSATIALDGGYGTGKTFILERWVQDLQDQGQVAVYYNAWENDCDDDPLVSLIETLASDGKIKWEKVTWDALNEALDGFLRKYTGVSVQNVRKAVADGQTVGLLDAAAARRKSRQTLKDLLAKLVDSTADKDGIAVVIDELDRCRPTFATELMERVKHVLNVPGLVFVFSVNMAALRETVRARYGDINAHQYLLRMFTATLNMPPGAIFHGREGEEQAQRYVKYLIDRHGLRAFCKRHQLLAAELFQAQHLLSLVAAGGGVTPREMERIVWLLARLASSSLLADRKAYSMLPFVLVPLAVAKVKDPDAYHDTVSMPDHAPAVINCLSELIHEAQLDNWQLAELDRLEMTMYRVCHQHPPDNYNSLPPAYVSLQRFAQEEEPSALESQHLSLRLTKITKERASTLLKKAPAEREMLTESGIPVHVSYTFETLQRITSRFDVVWPREPAR